MAVSDRKVALDQIKKSAWLWIPACAPIPLFGAIGIILYAWSQDSLSIFSVAMLVACGAWIAGGLLGFIFGIPRALATDRPETSVADTPASARHPTLDVTAQHHPRAL
jgi:hypothetical protein